MTNQADKERLSELRAAHLVEPDWLDSHLGDPSVAIVDMRGYVVTHNRADGYQTADYLGGRADYEESHIPGAVYLDWTRDIIDLDDPIPAQVAPPEKISRVLGEAGIGDDTLVVAYDSHPASQFATRLWWVLRYHGHDNVRVLNGGLTRWRAEGRPLTADLPKVHRVTFTPRVRPPLRKTAEDVLAGIGSEQVCIIDARDEGQYTGAIRRGFYGGHIPGAVHLPREAFFRPDGSFEDPDDLRAIVEANDIPADKEVVAYCNGGVAATTVLFTLSMIGRVHLSNYDGSWNEWGKRDDVPIVKGSNPG